MRLLLIILVFVMVYDTSLLHARSRSHGRGFNGTTGYGNSGYGGGYGGYGNSGFGSFGGGGFGGGGFGGFGGGGFGGSAGQSRGAEAGQKAAEKIAEKQKEIAEQAAEAQEQITQQTSKQQEEAQKIQQEFLKQNAQVDQETAKFLETFGGIVSDNASSLDSSSDYGSQIVQLINEGLQTQVNALQLQANFTNNANQAAAPAQGPDFSARLGVSGGAVNANANPIADALATTNANRNPIPVINSPLGINATSTVGVTPTVPRGANADLPRGLKSETYNFPKNFFD